MARKPNDVVEAAAQLADDYCMNLCAPDTMTPAQAIDFLERVVVRCESAVEALKEENDID